MGDPRTTTSGYDRVAKRKACVRLVPYLIVFGSIPNGAGTMPQRVRWDLCMLDCFQARRPGLFVPGTWMCVLLPLVL